MGNIFAITTPAETIKVDAGGKASAIFTVTNTSNKPIRGIALAKAIGATQQGWLDVEGETEKDFGAGGTQQFTVNFTSPDGEVGKFPFRLDVASATNPDEEFTEGPTVNVQTTAASLQIVKKGFSLWIIIVIAAAALLIGGLILFLVRRPDNPTQRVQENRPVENKPVGNKPVALAWATQITSPGFSNGTEEIIYIGKETHIYSNAQSADGTWLGEVEVKGQAKSICSAINREGEVEIFYIGPGTDNSIYHNLQSASAPRSWFGETPFLDVAGKSIACGKNADGRLEIFYVGTDNNIYHRWQLSSGGWSDQSKLEGTAREITVGSNKDGRLEIFHVGYDDFKIYHNWQKTRNGKDWEGETRLSEREIGQIVAVSHEDRELNIFYTGRDDKKIYRCAKIGENCETPLPGTAKQITAAVNSDGRIEVFYIGLDDNIYHDLQDTKNSDNWSGEMAMGGQKAQRIISIGDQNGRLEIFYVGMNNGLYHNWKKADGSWSGEMPVYTPL